MADIFDFFVYDDRSIQFTLAEPIMLEDKDVTEFRFRIPKSLNGFDMSTWAWWFVYVNAKREKFSIPLTLVDDEDEPDEYSVATFSLNYGMTGQVGKISFAIEVIDADIGTGEILHEWHTRTYTTGVTDTLQGNQVEYAEDESDIISALIQQVQALVAQGGLDATGVTSGYVPTADGNDGWSWQAQSGGGGGVTVDDALSTTSTNPVQNKVITENINSLTNQVAQKGTYSKPSGGIPKSDLASAVQTSLEKADTALQTAPVTSVNSQTGAVVIANATTSAAGLMSATDKSHLEAVYADYSSAITALGV